MDHPGRPARGPRARSIATGRIGYSQRLGHGATIFETRDTRRAQHPAIEKAIPGGYAALTWGARMTRLDERAGDRPKAQKAGHRGGHTVENPDVTSSPVPRTTPMTIRLERQAGGPSRRSRSTTGRRSTPIRDHVDPATVPGHGDSRRHRPEHARGGLPKCTLNAVIERGECQMATQVASTRDRPAAAAPRRERPVPDTRAS